jgi:L-fuculose-phosphate aldolase
MSLMRPDQMVIVDLDGNLIEGTDKAPSETVLHTEAYRARPDVGGVVHTHQMMATSFGIAGKEIRAVLHVDSPVLLNGQPFFEAPDLIMKPEEGEAVAQSLGKATFCHLRNHGIVVVGGTIEEATLNCIHLERLAQAEYNATQLGHVNVISWDKVRDLTRQIQGPAGRWAYYKALVEERDSLRR